MEGFERKPTTTWESSTMVDTEDNRLRTETGRTADNLKKWGIKENEKCECGEEQDADHLFARSLLSVECEKEDFMTTADISDKAIQIATHWEEKGI